MESFQSATFQSATAQTLIEVLRRCDSYGPLPPPSVDLSVADLRSRSYVSFRLSGALIILHIPEDLGTELFGVYACAVETFAQEIPLMALAAKTPARSSVTTGGIVDALETFMQRKCDSFQETLLIALQKYLNVKITQSALQQYLNVKIPQLAEADDENDAPENGTSSSDNGAAEADGANESPPEVVASFKPGLELACSKAQDEMALVAKATRITPKARQLTNLPNCNCG